MGLRALSDKLMNQLLSHLVLPVLVGSLVEVDKLVQKQQDILDEFDKEMNAVDDNIEIDPNNFITDNDQNDNKQEKIELNGHKKSDDDIGKVGKEPSELKEAAKSKSKSSSELDALDDKQKASNIRKFMERRTRISKQLSLFLLTQVLTVFSDGGLINAIIVALMHKHPPKLVNQIILSPPQHAVDTSIPVAHVLCQKRSYYRKDSQPSTPILTPSKGDSNNLIDNINNLDNDEDDEQYIKKSHRQEVVDMDKQNQIQRSRIESVEKMDIINDESQFPEDINLYRNELLNMLNSDPTETENEQLIASAAALILTIIRV